MYVPLIQPRVNSHVNSPQNKKMKQLLTLTLTIFLGNSLLAQQTPNTETELNSEPQILHQGTISNDLPQWNNYFNRKLSIGIFTILEEGKSKIIYYPYVNGQFLEGTLFPFDDAFSYSDPWINAEGDYMLMQANIDNDGKASEQFRICESKYVDGKWTQPKPLRSTYNMDGNAGSPSISKNGNLYFNALNENGDYDIFVLEEGNEKASALPKQINSKYFEGDFYIDSEEGFIVFSSIDRNNSKGNSDLYISFNEDGEWTPAISLGDKINTPAEEFSPYVSTDRRQLVFTSDRFQSRGFIPTYNHFIVDIDLEQIRKIFGE